MNKYYKYCGVFKEDEDFYLVTTKKLDDEFIKALPFFKEMEKHEVLNELNQARYDFEKYYWDEKPDDYKFEPTKLKELKDLCSTVEDAMFIIERELDNVHVALEQLKSEYSLD